MTIEWEVRPQALSDIVREWVTVTHDADGFWCQHWCRLAYDNNGAVTIFRRGPYELPATAEAEGARMAYLASIKFYMPDIRRKPPEPVRPADVAGTFAKVTMDAWLALPSPRARKLAFIAFLSRAAEAASEMVEYAPPEEHEE